MIKQRKRVTTIGILNASNWVRENIHQLTDLELTQAKWCEKLSEGSGESLTIPTAIEILEACGVRTGRKSPEETLVSRVVMLEQQVVGLLREIQSMQANKPEPVNGNGQLFPRAFNNESEVNCELSRS
jgi:hypothetical protein